MINFCKKHGILLGILALAAGLRFYKLGDESLWLDEATTVSWITQGLRAIHAQWTQGLLFLYLLKGWTALFGLSEIALRALPALLGVAGVGAIYWLGREMFGERAGRLAALLLAVNPFAIFYAQDARPYTLFLLTAVLAHYYALRMSRDWRTGDAIGLALSSVAMMYSHPFAPFALLSVFFVYIWLHPKDDLRHIKHQRKMLGFISAATLLLLAPQFWRFAQKFLAKTAAQPVATWITAPEFHELWHTPVRFFMLPVLGRCALLATLALVIWAWLRAPDLRRRIYALISMGACVFLFPFLISMTVTPIFVPRYTIPVVAALLLLLAMGLSRLPKWLRWTAVGLLLIGTAFPLYDYFTKVDKDPWRQLGVIMREKAVQKTLVVCYPPFVAASSGYYAHNLPNLQWAEIRDLSELPSLLKSQQHVWLITTQFDDARMKLSEIFSDPNGKWRSAETIRMRERIQANPWAYYIADVSLLAGNNGEEK